jgi:hypothetical protein
MPHSLRIASRLLAAIPGGYVLTACLVILISWLAAALGMHPAEAVTLGSLLGVLIYLLILIWALSTPKLWRVWLVVAAGSICYWALLTAGGNSGL